MYRGIDCTQDLKHASLREASEIAPFKQGGEVYLHGVAHPATPDQRMTEVALGIAFTDGK